MAQSLRQSTGIMEKFSDGVWDGLGISRRLWMGITLRCMVKIVGHSFATFFALAYNDHSTCALSFFDGIVNERDCIGTPI